MIVQKETTQGIFIINPRSNEMVLEISDENKCSGRMCGVCDKCVSRQFIEHGYIAKRFIRSTTLIIEGGEKCKNGK